MASKKKYRKVLLTILVLCIGVLLCACASSKDETVKVGSDEIPTIYSVVGERALSGTGTGTENGVSRSTLTYASGEISQDDLLAYADALESAGFIGTDASSDSLEMAKESVDEGKVVIVTMEFSESGNTVITYQVGEGTLTRY